MGQDHLDKLFVVWSLPACKQHRFGVHILLMLDLFRGREPEVEGDAIRVVDAVGKRETAIYLKRWRRR